MQTKDHRAQSLVIQDRSTDMWSINTHRPVSLEEKEREQLTWQKQECD